MGANRAGWVRVAGVCLGLAAAVATWVVAGPIIPSGTGGYSNLPVGSTHDIWNGPTGKRIGVKVQSTTSAVRVQTSPTNALGQVPQGKSAIFEGDWPLVQVLAMGAPATGAYETRGDTVTYSETDGTVGTATVALPPAGSAAGGFTVYKNFGSTIYRAMTVQAGTSSVSVRRTQTDPNLLTVDAGDWSYAGMGVATNGTLSLFGNDDVGYGIHDMRAGNAALSGTASGLAGDTDAIYVTGAKTLQITVTNTGSSSVFVGCSPTSSGTIPAGGNQVFTGAFTQFTWTYQGTGSQVTISIVEI